jgi:hypothetical protein
MVRADKFVTNKKEFMFIALAPFVIINAILLILLIFVSQPWALTILEVLFTHTAFASGDFGLLSYFDLHKSLDSLTIDNKERGNLNFTERKKTSIESFIFLLL